MAFPAYLSVTGSRQGQFKGESIQARRKNAWIPLLSFGMSLESPRDAATDQPSGERRFAPVRIVKEWGAASPQGLTACATNEALTQVLIEFTTTHPTGEEYVYQSMKLTNATISRVVRIKGGRGEGADIYELEDWEFTFAKIEVDDIDGLTKFTDDWVPGQI